MTNQLEKAIEKGWETRESVSPQTQGELRDAVAAAMAGLDSGELRVASKEGGDWTVHQWLKKAVLLSFRLNDMQLISALSIDISSQGEPVQIVLRIRSSVSNLESAAMLNNQPT